MPDVTYWRRKIRGGGGGECTAAGVVIEVDSRPSAAAWIHLAVAGCTGADENGAQLRPL